MSREIEQELLKSIPGYSSVYHDDIFLQHHHYYLINRQHNLAMQIEADKQSYYPLNHANSMLGRFCKRKIDSLPARVIAQYPDLYTSLRQSIEEWQQRFNAGAVFDTCRYARQILEVLETMGFGVCPDVLKEEGIADVFLHIPFFTKSGFQLSFSVPDPALLGFFERMITSLARDPVTTYYIKEVKITYNLFRKDPGRDAYRIVKVGLLPKVVITKLNPVIGVLTGMVTEILSAFGPDQLEADEFFSRQSAHVYLSQGNVNYKLFLQMLGLIDLVYDRSSKYALIKP